MWWMWFDLKIRYIMDIAELLLIIIYYKLHTGGMEAKL